VDSLTLIPLLWLLGTPVAAILAWIWSRDPEVGELPQWRRGSLFVGLVAAPLNLLIFLGWFLYRLTGDHSNVWHLKEICSSSGVVLCFTAFIGAAVASRGRASVALSISAVLGFFLWVPIGVL